MHSKIFGLQYLCDYDANETPSVTENCFFNDAYESYLPSDVESVSDSPDLEADLLCLKQDLIDKKSYLSLRKENDLWILKVDENARAILLEEIIADLQNVIATTKRNSSFLYCLRKTIQNDYGFLFYIDNWAQSFNDFIHDHSGVEFVVDSSLDYYF